MVNRIYIEKKDAPNCFKQELSNFLKIDAKNVREILRLDVEGIDSKEFEKAGLEVLADLTLDNVYFENIDIAPSAKTIIVAPLEGQYDQLAHLTAQTLQVYTLGEMPLVKTAKLYVFEDITDKELQKIQKFLINPVESCLALARKPQTLKQEFAKPQAVESVDGFINMDEAKLKNYFDSANFAMTFSDLLHVQNYFLSQKRNPTQTEIKVIDTYWSDHCRHTTFLTELTNIDIQSQNPNIAKSYSEYKELFNEINGKRQDKYECLMDMATIAAKKLRKDGYLDNLDISDEINACSINVKVDVDGQDQDYILMFKNETHNHPTEIEPFGGAATCLGGGIRDPLSGRVDVFHSMRITGSGDPRAELSQTLPGKLAQRVITKTAAAGFTSYGNQIGLTAGYVDEVYHEGFVAKRMEAGYTVGAAKKEHIYRVKPQAGDSVLLLGGKTGRDGCGGATGSSKSQNIDSAQECSAEVQKGDPLLERAIMRLFNNPNATLKIKKCNDFGAGGVCVAIGELADGLLIDLNKVPAKYEGLSGTELAISESQERMAVVVAKEDAQDFIKLADSENLECTHVATVTDTDRMVMTFNGQVIVDISREFLNTNGVRQTAKAIINDQTVQFFTRNKTFFKQGVLEKLSNLNVCSQKGLAQLFDSTIGARSVYLPYGGKYQLTPAISMAAKIPVPLGKTDTAAVSSYAFQPYLLEQSPYTGSIYSVVCSVAKLVASGVNKETIRLSFQEYFHRLNSDPVRFGKPVAALLGALSAQMGLKLGAIGGKDSMSGTFENVDVPPTLISFAIGVEKASKLITNVLDKTNVKLYLLPMKKDAYKSPDFEHLNALYQSIYQNIQSGNINFATVVETGGVAASVIKSCLGNKLGFEFLGDPDYLISENYGDIIVAAKDISTIFGAKIELGQTIESNFVCDKEIVTLEQAINAFTSPLNSVFFERADTCELINEKFDSNNDIKKSINILKGLKPKVLIPVLPGITCEREIANKFILAGASVELPIFLNRTKEDIKNSLAKLSKSIKDSNILVLPSGYNLSQESTSAAFMLSVIKNPQISQAILQMLSNDALILGIGCGFEALVKSGLLPNKTFTSREDSSLSIAQNLPLGYVSTIADIKIMSNKSPWLNGCKVGQVYQTVISQGNGQVVLSKEKALKLFNGGQIASVYTGVGAYQNPGNSSHAIESITSPDGKILGKFGHIERFGENLMKNFDGNFDLKMFESGVNYFK